MKRLVSHIAVLFVFISLSVLASADDAPVSSPPPVVRVELSDENCVIYHKGPVTSEFFDLRVNVPNTKAIEFQRSLKRYNCDFLPPTTIPQFSSNLYPRVATLDGVDNAIHIDELIKIALGKNVIVTRNVPGSNASGVGNDSKSENTHESTQKVIHGTLMGWTGTAAAYSLQLLNEKQAIAKIESTDIVDIAFIDQLPELQQLANLLKRQSDQTGSVLHLRKSNKENPEVIVTQPAVASHKYKVDVFATANETLTETDSIDAWATIWNDTFYDWINATVILKSQEQTYEIQGVNLAFGQEGAFRITSDISKVALNNEWVVKPPAAPGDVENTAALTSNVFSLRTTQSSPIPSAIWHLRNQKGALIADNIEVKELVHGKSEKLIVDNFANLKVTYTSNTKELIPISVEKRVLNALRGKEIAFTFKSPVRVVYLRGKGFPDTEFEINSDASVITPRIVIEPGIANGDGVSISTDNPTLTMLSLGTPTDKIALDVVAVNAAKIHTLAKTLNWRFPERAQHKSLDNIAEIVERKTNIESLRRDIANLTAAKLEGIQKQNNIDSSSLRGSIYRDLAKVIQVKNDEIEAKKDELAIAEVQLNDLLDSQPIDLNAAAMIRKMGGTVISTPDQSPTLVAFGIGKTEVDEDKLFNAIDLSPEKLETLLLPGCKDIRGARLGGLSGKRLAWLDLSGTGVSDDSLAEWLSDLTQLRSLDVSGTETGDGVALALSKLKRLESLSMAATDISPKGLLSLCALKSLKKLNLKGTKLSYAQLKAFQTRRPDITIFPEPKPEELPPKKIQLGPSLRRDSFWFQPVDKEQTLHEQNAILVAEFLKQKAAGIDDLVGINTNFYAAPIYVADADAPGVQVLLDRCLKIDESKYSVLQEMFQSVPVPEFAIPADGTDGEMVVYQPSTDTLWEFWRARKDDDGNWYACWGGKTEHASMSDGIYPSPFGVTATCLSFCGGQITAEELLEGEITHAMGIALVRAAKGKFCWPAQKDDGAGCDGTANCVESDLIQEGQRFRLNPKINVDELDMHPTGKIIAKAAQKYGFVVWDKAGTTSIRAVNPKSYTQIGLPDPYPDLFCPQDQYTVLNGFPWDQLEFLPSDFGRPLPR